MESQRQKRRNARKIRRGGENRWYHVFDVVADILWFFVDIPFLIIKGIFHVIISIFKGIWYIIRGFFSILGDILDIFNVFS